MSAACIAAAIALVRLEEPLAGAVVVLRMSGAGSDRWASAQAGGEGASCDGHVRPRWRPRTEAAATKPTTMPAPITETDQGRPHARRVHPGPSGLAEAGLPAPRTMMSPPSPLSEIPESAPRWHCCA